MRSSGAGTDPEPAPQQGVQEDQWTQLVEKIRSDNAAGMEELYKVFAHGVRFQLCRQLGGQDLDDRVHECFLIVAQAIRRGDLRQPERLMGFVRTVVRRQVAARIEEAGHDRRQVSLDFGMMVHDDRHDPEREAILRQQQELARRVLKGVSGRDREVLVRFYLEEQGLEQICREMGLTETQFRLLKSRAKARFSELGKRRLARRLARF